MIADDLLSIRSALSRVILTKDMRLLERARDNLDAAILSQQEFERSACCVGQDKFRFEPARIPATAGAGAVVVPFPGARAQ